MYTNGGMVSFDRVLQLIARLDSQSLSNFLGNGRLPLACHRRMQHDVVLTVKMFLTMPFCLTFVASASAACSVWSVGRVKREAPAPLARCGARDSTNSPRPRCMPLRSELISDLSKERVEKSLGQSLA